MESIARTLEALGHATFLPHRDGLELSRLESRLHEHGLSPIDASKMIDRSIFCLDVYQLLSWSDGVVINLNGRVPDEGTVVEAALAWHAGKPLVLYKNDSRAPFLGRDNPMLTGLGNYQIVRRIDELGDALETQLTTEQESRRAKIMNLGARLADARRINHDNLDFIRVMKDFL